MISPGDLVQFSNFVVAREAAYNFQGDHIAEPGVVGLVTSCYDAGPLETADPYGIGLEVLVGDSVLYGIDPEDVTVVRHGGKNVGQ